MCWLLNSAGQNETKKVRPAHGTAERTEKLHIYILLLSS